MHNDIIHELLPGVEPLLFKRINTRSPAPELASQLLHHPGTQAQVTSGVGSSAPLQGPSRPRSSQEALAELWDLEGVAVAKSPSGRETQFTPRREVISRIGCASKGEDPTPTNTF